MQEGSQTRVFYVRDHNRFPIAAIAYAPCTGVGATGWLSIGVSVWNPNDEFSKQKGRAIAEGRANAAAPGVASTGKRKKFTFYFNAQVVPLRELHVAIANELLACSTPAASRAISLPNRVQRALKDYASGYWLL